MWLNCKYHIWKWKVRRYKLFVEQDGMSMILSLDRKRLKTWRQEDHWYTFKTLQKSSDKVETREKEVTRNFHKQRDSSVGKTIKIWLMTVMLWLIIFFLSIIYIGLLASRHFSENILLSFDRCRYFVCVIWILAKKKATSDSNTTIHSAFHQSADGLK